MKNETKVIARQMFSTCMTTAQNLGTISSEERNEMFKMAAELCFEAASAFQNVADTK